MRWDIRRRGIFVLAALCTAPLVAIAGCGTGYVPLDTGGTTNYVFTENFQFDQGTFNDTNDTTVPGTVRLNGVATAEGDEGTFGTFVPSGTWTVVVDSGTTDATWSSIFWNTEPEASQPPGTQINVAVRAANDPGDLASLPFAPVANGATLAGFTGRYLEVQATLVGVLFTKPVDGSTLGLASETPVLSDLTVTQSLLGNNIIEQLPFGGDYGQPGGPIETPQEADLALIKSVSNPTPSMGDTITFTVTLTNIGPDAATNVQVLDLLPPGLTFVSATPSQGSYDGLTGVWTVGSVAVGTPQTLTIVGTVGSAGPQTNTATIGGVDQPDPNPENNVASATETPLQADLALSKSVSNAAPIVGDTVTFTVTLTNIGPGGATNVAVTDLLPAGLTFVSATPSQGTYTAATGLWNVGTVVVGTPQTLDIAATVASSSPQTNTATISGADQIDPDTANNTASAAEAPPADLALTKTVSDPAPNVGDTITFTVTLTDNGPEAATSVQVQDLLPAGLTFVSATPSQGTYTSSTGVWDVGTVTVSTAQTLILVATVASGTAQTNTATVGSVDQFDPDTGNNAASATVVPQQADLALTKTVSNATPNVGDTITFTVTLSNGGPDTATGVAVNDLLPAGLTFVSAVPSQGSYDSLTGVWVVGSVASGGSGTLTLTTTVVSPSAQTNTAAISDADQFDPSTANNTASATETPQQADLALSKSVSNPTPSSGSNVTFTITLTNDGPDAATGVQVSDLLPAGLTFVSASASQGSYDAVTGIWTVGTVAAGTPLTLAVVVTVASTAPQTNTATITDADQFDPNTANDSASATVDAP